MKNSLIDLNDHLFAQLERLGEEQITGDALDMELRRTKALTDVAKTIVTNASLALQAKRLQLDFGNKDLGLPMLTNGIKNGGSGE